MKKRKTWILLAAAVLTPAVFVLRITVAEPASLVVNFYTVEVPDLPPEHDGLTVAVAGDLHFSGRMPAGLPEKITSLLEKERPDVVLLAGDFFERHVPPSLPEVDILAQHVTKWRGAYGTAAVAGNHDVYPETRAAWARLAEHLRKAGVAVLDGDVCRIPVRGKVFQIAGFEDRKNIWSKMKRASSGMDDSLPKYALIHDPKYLFYRDNPCDVIFSAHTHRGQLRPPVFGESFLEFLFRLRWLGSGVRRYRNCTQITTSGMGESTLPARYRNLPEIVIVTLRRPAGEPR